MKNKLLFCLVVLLIPIMVHADMGAPVIPKYDVKITNKEGSYLLKWNGSTGSLEKVYVEYGTTIEGIMYEEIIEGKAYGYAQEGYVLLEDSEVISKKPNLKDYKKEEKLKRFVYKEGAYLYNGPALVYGKVKNEVMIPVGVVLESDIYDEMFMYVTYKGTSGWVYYYPYKESTYEETSLAIYELNEFMTLNSTKLMSMPNDGEEVLTIPPKVKLKSLYCVIGLNSEYYYVKYKGKYGWITEGDNSSIARKNTFKIYNIEDDTKIYTYADKASEIIGSIPKNTFIVSDYYTEYSSWFRVKYNGITGFIKNEEDKKENFVVSYTSTIYKLNNDLQAYDNYMGKKIDKDLTEHNIIVDFFIYDSEHDTDWYHVSSPEECWLQGAYDDFEYIRELEKDETYEDVKDIKDGNEYKAKKVYNLKELLVYILGGTIVLAISTIIAIKLINKKKEVNGND